MKKNLMENTEGQKANARGEDNDKIKRVVVVSLSCRPGGTATGNTTNKGDISKNRKKGKGPVTGSPPTKPGWTSFIS